MHDEEDEFIRMIRDKYPMEEQAKNFYQQVLIKKSEIRELKKEMENVKNHLFLFFYLKKKILKME